MVNLALTNVAADPVNDGALFVPAGVPALTALVVAEDPVKVWAGTVPEVPVNVGTPAGQDIAPSLNAPLAFVGTPTGQDIAPSLKAPPLATGTELGPVGHAIVGCVKTPAAMVGTLAGHEIVCAGTVPALPLNVWAGTVPEFPVNVGALFVPDGVILLLPPVVPTSPCAARVPITVTPSNCVASLNPLGQEDNVITMLPLGIEELVLSFEYVPPTQPQIAAFVLLIHRGVEPFLQLPAASTTS